MKENSQPSGEPILVLFDVDGTLINSYEFDTELFVQAVREVTGMVISGDWASYTYVSDGGVLQEEIARQGLAGNADEWERKVKERFTQMTQEHLHASPGNLEKPGARQFVEHLLDRRDCVVGVATGGWGATARLKLQHIGLGKHLANGRLALATSSDHHNRLAIMRLAERRAKANWSAGAAASASAEQAAATTGSANPAAASTASAGANVQEESAARNKPLHHKIYFGDGPWDQRACADLGYHFIAIGDRIAHPHRFDDFRNHQALLQAAGLAG
jgi:beta-phosphoglucomutase-like phosphatase (HAD superfamily)